MRFHYGAVPVKPSFHPEKDGWRPIREPGAWALQLFALPAAVVLLLMDGWLIQKVMPAGISFINIVFAFPGLSVIWIFVAIVPLHELIHAALHPGGGLTENSILGLWPARLLFYAHYEGPMSRNRLLMVAAGPGLILSLVPVILILCLASVGVSLDMLARLAYLSLLGALAACGDLVVFLAILLQIPASATVQNQGWRTYWKPHAALAQPSGL